VYKKPISVDLRERILRAYDRGEGTQEEVAQRFAVSYGMVKKLIQQRRHTGQIGIRRDRCGRKPVLLVSHRTQLRTLLARKPDQTLRELRTALGVECTIQAIHYVLAEMGLTYKKRRSGPASKSAPTSRRRDGAGGASKRGSTRRG
jgi:transposase